MGLELGKETFNAIGQAVNSILSDYSKDLQSAYMAAEKDLSLAISVKIESVPEGNKIEVSLNFVKERIKDKVVQTVSEKQGKLFDEKEK